MRAILIAAFSLLSFSAQAETIVANVNGMVCAMCVTGIERSFRKQPAVDTVKVDLVLKDGTVYNIGETYPKGHPKNPFTHEELLWKFRTLSERAIPDGERVGKIIDAVLNLERLDRFNELADLLTTRA